MSTILYWLKPLNWVKTSLGIAIMGGALIAGLLWAKHSYDVKVTKEAVAEALKDERAKTTPAFEALTQQFKDIETNVIETRKQAKRDAEAAVAKEKDRADKATEKYKAELLAKKQVTTALEKSESVVNKLRSDSVPNLTKPIATHDGDSSEVGRLREFADGLGRILAQCQQTASDLRRTAATAISRMGEAEAAARALKHGD